MPNFKEQIERELEASDKRFAVKASYYDRLAKKIKMKKETAGEYLISLLNEVYIGKTIKGFTDILFVVDLITIEVGDYGDPPPQLFFQSKRLAENSKELAEWRKNNPTTAPLELRQKWRESMTECLYVGFNEKLPETV